MNIYQQITQNRIKTYVILGVFIVLFTGFFAIIGASYDNAIGYALVGLVIASVSSVWSYYNSHKIVLKTTKARPARKEEFFDLYTVTENLSLAAGVPMPAVYVIDDPSPNAFATGRNPKHAVVCATTGLLALLDRAELEGVIAHELSHVKNYDMLVSTLTAVLVGTVALTADWILRSMWWGGSKDRNKSPIMIILLIVALILTPIVATIIQLAVSRRREYLADASGALLTRHPAGLASALAKISAYPKGVSSAGSSTAHLFFASPFRKGGRAHWMQKLFSTHPPVAKRIEVLQKM